MSQAAEDRTDSSVEHDASQPLSSPQDAKGSDRKTVFIVTYCQDLESLYGSTLVFKTLRIGFPTAEVHVVDNNSLPEAAAEIRAPAEATGCQFHAMPPGLPHFILLYELVLKFAPEGTAILLHPDVCFWENCEGWSFDKLIAGRLIPQHWDILAECLLVPHLHSQFWWIQDVRRFRERILNEYIKAIVDPVSAFAPYYLRHEGVSYKFEVGASLYANFKEEIHCFTERELDCYDHLIGGTYAAFMIRLLKEAKLDLLAESYAESHSYAKGDYEMLRRLKGSWRKHEDYYRYLATDSSVRPILQRGKVSGAPR